jgi:hypothetical protein
MKLLYLLRVWKKTSTPLFNTVIITNIIINLHFTLIH